VLPIDNVRGGEGAESQPTAGTNQRIILCERLPHARDSELIEKSVTGPIPRGRYETEIWLLPADHIPDQPGALVRSPTTHRAETETRIPKKKRWRRGTRRGSSSSPDDPAQGFRALPSPTPHHNEYRGFRVEKELAAGVPRAACYPRRNKGSPVINWSGGFRSARRGAALVG